MSRFHGDTLSDKVSKKKKRWLVGCFEFNGPLRQYFSLYRAASQREGERGEKRIHESRKKILRISEVQDLIQDTSWEKGQHKKDITIGTTSDSQVNSNFPNKWSPASLTFNNNFYLFLYVYIT